MGKFANVLVGALAVLAFSSCAEEKKGYVIDGQVTDVKDGMMYLKKYVGKSFVDVDSTAIVDGKFKFEGVISEALAHGLTTRKESSRPMVFFLENNAMNITMNESGKEMAIQAQKRMTFIFEMPRLPVRKVIVWIVCWLLIRLHQ